MENQSNILLDFDKSGVLLFQSMEIEPLVRDILKFKKPVFDSQNEKNNFLLNFIDIFEKDSLSCFKLIELLRGKKELLKIQELTNKLLEYCQIKENENLKHIPRKDGILFQIVIRSKSGKFKGFYISIPISHERESI